jgi:hypothetical protein
MPGWSRAVLCLVVAVAAFISKGRGATLDGIAETNPELLARAACSACHLFPAPALLDRTIWPEHIFPKMRLYMGLDRVDASKSRDAQILEEEKYFPGAPMVTEAAWQRITNWYMSKAPAPTNPPSRNELIPITLRQFKATPPRFRRNPPLTTLVQIDRTNVRRGGRRGATHRVFAGRKHHHLAATRAGGVLSGVHRTFLSAGRSSRAGGVFAGDRPGS